MAEGNGADTGAMLGLLRQILTAQESMRQSQTAMRQTLDVMARSQDAMRGDLLELKARVAAHDRRFDDVEHGVASLRQEVADYHGAVVGHGVLISELDERLRRVEDARERPSG